MHYKIAAIALATISFAVPAAAQPSPIDEISVTATRRQSQTGDVSAALSIVSRETVLANKLVTDALRFAPGVSLQQTTPGQGAAIIRGLKGSSLLHMVDGLRLNNAIIRSAPTPYLAYVPTTAVERVEIIRGTSPSLYGSDAVGGVVQIVTRIPEFESTENQLNADLLLSFDSAELQKSIRGVIDAGNKDLAMSFSGEYLSTGDRRTGNGGRVAPSAYTSRAARIAIHATPKDTQSWLLDVHLLEQPATPRIDELVAGFGQSSPSSSEFAFTPSQRLFARSRYRVADGALGLDWKFDAAWQRIVDDRTSRDFNSTVRTHEANRSDLWGATAAVSGTTTTGSWIVGTEWYYDTVSSARSTDDLISGNIAQVQSRFPNDSSVKQLAAYGNTDWLLSDRHRISAGLRLSNVRIDVPAAVNTAASTIDIKRISGDIGWIFDINGTSQVVANAGYGFRAPNIFDLGTLGTRPGNRFNIPNTDLGAEKVRHFDVGYRHNAAAWQTDLVIYEMHYDDRISSVLTGATTADGRDIVQSVNAAQSTLRGAEVSLGVELSQSVTLQAVANYAWGSEQMQDGIEQPADRVPPLHGRINVTVVTGTAWTFDAWLASAASQSRLSDRDLRDNRIDPTGSDGWAMAGVQGRWLAPGGWQITFGIDNLLDNNYRVHGSGIDAPGRNFSASFRRSW